MWEEFDPPPNDVCSAAIAVDPGGSLVRVSGYTTNATVETAGCASGPSQGVWYTLIGTGNPIRASICSDATAFDGEVFVSYGDNQTCRSRNCPQLKRDDSGPCGYQNQQTCMWDSHQDVTYYINVHGTSPGGVWTL
jgi:hypothetical protein